MKTYEVVFEIFNECANNQMRDVFFEEVDLEDPQRYVLAKYEGKPLEWEREDLEGGVVIMNLNVSGIKQRYTLTPI